jgi:hypothetical protein
MMRPGTDCKRLAPVDLFSIQQLQTLAPFSSAARLWHHLLRDSIGKAHLG